MALPLTGDITQTKAVAQVPVALALPRVTKTELLDATSAINDFGLSGKGDGGLLLAVDGANRTIVTATGQSTTSTWITVGAATSVVYATPV